MGLSRIVVMGSLVLLVASALQGCVLGNNEKCPQGASECVGTTGAYRVCDGGEGYYYWENEQCPGIQPVCSVSGAGLTCGDLAAPPSCSRVSVLLNVATAKLSNVVNLDRDGSADLVFDGDVVARSNGQGGFEQPHSLGLVTAGHLLGLFPAELNGDGVADLAVTSKDPLELYAFLGNADGSYAFAQRYFVDSLPGFVAAADFDGDGRDELVGVNYYEGVHVISGLGDAELTDRLIDTSTDSYQGASALNAFVADFDGQPPLDLATDSQRLDVYLTQADGSHRRAASMCGEGVTVGNLDADERADVACTTLVGSDGPGFSLHFAGSDAAFTHTQNLRAPYPPNSVFIADFDGDGLNDIAALLDRPQQALLQVFVGNGRGGFQARDLVSLTFDANTSVFVADVDQDGRADLVTQVGSRVLDLSGACLTQ